MNQTSSSTPDSKPLSKTTIQLVTTVPVCPRCFGFIPSNEAPGRYRGALSRVDNETEVCSECGKEEDHIDRLFPKEVNHDASAWPLERGRTMVRAKDVRSEFKLVIRQAAFVEEEENLIEEVLSSSPGDLESVD